MKKYMKEILLFANTVLLCVCLGQIVNIRMELQNMKSNMGYQISSLQTNLNNSYSYIEETLAKEASIVSKAQPRQWMPSFSSVL